MAEKTYTLEQAAAKLGKSAEEFKEFVKNNSISELREGANVLYDAKEIDALAMPSADDTVLNIEDSVIGLNDESSLLGLASLDEASDKDDEFEIDANMSSMVELTEADTRGGLTSQADDDSILSLADSINSESTNDEAKINADNDIDTADDGSGSGLLDLSLQADDSQFGAVLDDILPGGDDDLGGFGDIDDDIPSSGSGFADGDSDESVNEVAAADAADVKEEDYAVSEPSPVVAPVAARMTAQSVEVDSTSGVFGLSMLFALLATIFALIILTAGLKSITPSIFVPMQDYILYIFGGLAALSLLVAVIGSLASGTGKEKKAKADKPKKAKKTKKKK